MRMRPYAGVEDLRAMQALAQEIWTPGSRWHVGDLAWDRLQHIGRETEWPTALWEEDGQLLGWGWTELPGDLSLQVRPERAELASQILAWFEETATAQALDVTVLDAEEHLVRALGAHGYRPLAQGPFLLHSRRTLDDLPAPHLPEALIARPLQGDRDIAARADVHRAAFAPSRVTAESYRQVTAAWPYRQDLDWVVQAPDGSFAAYCLIWLDAENGVGEIEPTGTRPEYRRMGLGRAVCLAALHALRHLGAREAIVYCRGDAAYPVPKQFYAGMGFRPHARTVTFRRRR